jgi:predicted membrane-bound spermidine synthase
MRATLALIFFLSGASALIFELLWFRLAGLSLGNSVWSASLVLAAFMGGLALGNRFVAQLHHRVLRPVRLYATLEFTIGASGIAAVMLLPQLPDLLSPILRGFTDMPVLLNTTRVAIAFTILVIPATAMGATLPVLAKALARQDSNFGANIGWLYGWNTLGATLAVFSTALFLIPALGLLSSGLVALVCNLTAAVIALHYAQGKEPSPTRSSVAPPDPVAIDWRTGRYLAIAFFSGALMLALEVVWFRFLLLTTDGTSVIFGVMLAVVLAGIAIGGLVAAHLFRRNESAYEWLPHVIAASAVLVVVTYWGYDIFTEYRREHDVTIPEFIGYAMFLMFPVAFLSGVSFTMVNRAVKEQLGASARTAGITTFYNTIGAMLGSLVGGFVLLPMIGMENSFFLIAALYFGTALLVPSESRVLRHTLFAGRAAAAVALASLVLFPFGLMQASYFVDKVSTLPNHSLIDSREGLVETIRYFSRDVYGQPQYYRLATNGHSMSATSTAAKRYMKLYVYLPVALKADTSDALLISFGVGSTAKALTDSKGIESIDVVDISKDILEMSSIIYPGDDNPLRDERVKVHIEDGRFFLNTTSKRYDLITSEPPPPKLAGVVNLYSEEYFKLIRKRLKTGGYASYWLPVQQLDPTDALAIIKAFCNAFDDCSLWSGAGLEWMLLGSNGAERRIEASDMTAQWRDPNVFPELVALGFESAAQLGSLFMADAEHLRQLTAEIRPVTDNHPARISSRLVNFTGYVEVYGRLMDEAQRLERFRNSKMISERWPAALRGESERFFKYERLIKNHFTGNAYRLPSDTYAWEAIDDLLTNTSLTTLPLWLLGSNHGTQQVITNLLESEGYRGDFALDMARRFTAERDYETALMYLNDHMTSSAEVTHWTASFYLYLLARNGLSAEAGQMIAQMKDLEGPEVVQFLGWYIPRFAQDAVADVVPRN